MKVSKVQLRKYLIQLIKESGPLDPSVIRLQQKLDQSSVEKPGKISTGTIIQDSNDLLKGIPIFEMDDDVEIKKIAELVNLIKNSDDAGGIGDAYESLLNSNTLVINHIVNSIVSKGMKLNGGNIIDTNAVSTNSPFSDIAVGAKDKNPDVFPIEGDDFDIELIENPRGNFYFQIDMKTPVISAKSSFAAPKSVSTKGDVSFTFNNFAYQSSTIKPHTIVTLAHDIAIHVFKKAKESPGKYPKTNMLLEKLKKDASRFNSVTFSPAQVLLKLGAASMTSLIYLVDKYGL